GRDAALSRSPRSFNGSRRIHPLQSRRRSSWRASHHGKQRPWSESATSGGAASVTRTDQFKAVVDLGFTDRQARFLVAVMLFSGVCFGRQYCAFAGIVRRQKMYDFFSSLVADRWATVYTTAHRRAHLYHVHSKRLYAAIGEPHNRHRKPVTLARAVERL